MAAERTARSLAGAAWGLLLFAQAVLAQGQHDQHHPASHQGHRMVLNERGMVMNGNEDVLPRDCRSVSAEYDFEVSAGAEFADGFPGTTFTYDVREFEVQPCSLVRVTFHNRDQVRHQWMVHGLPRYLYPGGMFHLEAAGGETMTGGFIVPGDRKTYLVHCDITQHMEKGMKAQLKVGGGDGDLWAVPGYSSGIRRDSYLPGKAWIWLLLAGAASSCFYLVFRA